MSESIRGIVVYKDSLLLIKRIREGDTFYVFPGGHRKDSETRKEACQREVKEETGLDIEPREQIFTLQEGPCHKSIYYECEVMMGDNARETQRMPHVELTGEEKARSNAENLYEPMWIKIEQIKDFVIYPARLVSIIEKMYSCA